MGSVETMETLNKKELVKLVSYMAMGDGGLYQTTDARNAYFAMNMMSANMDYILLCQGVMVQVTRSVIYRLKVEPPRQPQVRLNTSTHPFFTTIRDRIYTGTYKGIDPHALKLLDAQALAILYMCDGSLVTEAPNLKKGLVNPSFNVTLNLKRLSYGDQFILKKALKDILDLEWNIQRQNEYYYLRLRSKDIDKFMEMVAPWVVPSFQYKLKECFRTVSSQWNTAY